MTTENGGIRDERLESFETIGYEFFRDVPSVLVQLVKNHNNLARQIECGGLTMAMASWFGIENKNYDEIINEARSDEMFSGDVELVEATRSAMADHEIGITSEEFETVRDIHTRYLHGETSFSEDDLSLLQKFAPKVDAVYQKLISTGRWDHQKIAG